MLYLNTARADSGRVNLRELADVRQHHMPAPLVRFATLCELERVAAETSCQHPQLREETQFVLHEELGRRQRLATPLMRVVEGAQRNG